MKIKCPCCGNPDWNGKNDQRMTIYGLKIPEILEIIEFAEKHGYLKISNQKDKEL